jgi:hypothetical protein
MVDRDALADPFGYSDLRGAAAEQQADSTARPMVGVVLKTHFRQTGGASSDRSRRQ